MYKQKQFISFIFIIISYSCKTEENILDKDILPTVITKSASAISLTAATLNGEITNEGNSSTFDRGFVYSDKNTNPSGSDKRVQTGFGKGTFSVEISNLNANTKYFYNTYAFNSKGVSYGETQSFTTADYKLPTVTSEIPIEINYFSAVLSGTVTDEGGSLVTERGFCYSANPNPTISENKIVAGTGKGSFISGVYNLKDNSKYYYRAYALNIKGISYGIAQSFNTQDASNGFRDTKTKVVEVKSKTGRIWMDRNLGASQVALNLNDKNAFGELYQWGRGADGHQVRFSPTTNIQSNTDIPGHDYFITAMPPANDWRKEPNNNLWQGVKGINNPCPVGYRLPTADEWELEINTWLSKDVNGAFSSTLKLPTSDDRVQNGIVSYTGNYFALWGSTITNFFNENYITIVNVGKNYATVNTNGTGRANAAPVRCIKD